MKRFLLPVDDSLHCTYALRYVVHMGPILQDAAYSLFYVQPMVSEYLRQEARTDSTAMDKLRELNKKNESMAKELLDRRKKELVRLGVPEEKVEVATQPRQEGIARDILRQAGKLSADGVVIGRHIYSRLQDTFIGSMSKNVIEHCTETPVWLINSEVDKRNMLLAIDGSTDSAKALDYVVDVTCDNPDVDLTIFHVQPSFRDCCEVDFEAMQLSDAEDETSYVKIVEKANRQCMDNFVEYAGRKLKERNLHEDRLKMKSQPTSVNIGKAIVDEFNTGDYGTVVVGKRGFNKRFFMGSVSNYLVSHLEAGALWIIP